MGLRRYLELLRIPGVTPLLLWAFVARLPYAVFSLALILLLRSEGFDYAAIGIVLAASGLSAGVSAPLYGRLIDRVGQTRVLVTTAVLGAVTEIALVVAALAGGGTVLLALLAVAGGVTIPPVSASLRTLLPGLVGRERIDTAFAFDALQLEVVFISGPLLAAGIATLISPAAAVLTAAAMQTAGALGVAAVALLAALAAGAARARDLPGGRPVEPGPAHARGRAHDHGGLARGARDLHPGLRRASTGRAATPAGCSRSGPWAPSSAGSGTARASGAAARVRRFFFVSSILALGLAPLPLAGSLPAFAVLLVVAGLGLAPSTAVCYSFVGELAPEGAVTEAYAWQIVAYVGGSSVGAWLAGVVIDAVGVATALACAPRGGGAGAAGGAWRGGGR